MDANADTVGACRAVAARRRAECSDKPTLVFAAAMAETGAAVADLHMHADAGLNDVAAQGRPIGSKGAGSVGTREAAAAGDRDRSGATHTVQCVPATDAVLPPKGAHENCPPPPKLICGRTPTTRGGGT